MKKTRKRLRTFACMLLVVLMIGCSVSVCAYAKESYISEVTLASGTNAREKLEKGGYTVLFQGMNLVTGENEESLVVLGYKKGSNAITDFLVSTQKESTVTYAGRTYQPVSGTSLNNGTDGTALYLYYTRDAAAGDGIVSLDTVSGFTDKDQVVPLKNDGSSPVRTDGGKLANLDQGISGQALYLLMYRDGTVRPYISNACMVTAGSKAKAVQAVASKGCDYYLESDLSDSKNQVTYIGYQRTDDKAQAINRIAVSGDELKCTKNQDTGAYLMDISGAKLFDKSFTLGQWAGVYAAGDRSVSKTSAAYKALAASKDACSCTAVENAKVYAVYLGSLKAAAETATDAEITAAESTTGADATDARMDIEKEETDAETTESGNDSDKTASVFNSGNIRTIVIFTVVIVMVLAGILIYRKKGGMKNEKDEKEV